VERAGPFASLPLVVLVSANTASAAIIADAFRLISALLIGATTYGKDTIQLVFQPGRWIQPAHHRRPLVDPGLDFLGMAMAWSLMCPSQPITPIQEHWSGCYPGILPRQR
jgi:hypothetical protein